ncbi:hypothetical protein SteCoe_18914 [Stentor coeruleus]|uniref:Uncharacterized protein n=1 Tax=Stentor coeruleus TaxID=5963 RepID=A0A1R2BVJ6_9CILI|nr:hypothetical protein SteCoe_18914 [Stentor coeruleus]
MKKYHDDKCRSKSIDSKSHNNSVCSILKDPSRSKLKHQRSVRFLEPEDFSSEGSLESKSVCQQQFKAQKPKGKKKSLLQYSSPRQPIAEKHDHSHNLDKYMIKDHKSQDMQYNHKESKIKPQIHKFIVKNKTNKGHNFSASPKFEPKVINYNFRDKNFYDNLNRFISHKSSTSPKRHINHKHHEDTKLNVSVSNSHHSANKPVGIVSSPCEPNSAKVYYKSLGVQNLHKNMQGRIFKPHGSYLLN